jgi:hypothetical protein
MQKISGMSEDNLFNIIDQTLAQGAPAAATGTTAGATTGATAGNAAANKAKAAEEDALMHAVEEEVAEAIYRRIVSAGYYRPRRGWVSPVPWDLESKIERLLRYHDFIRRYELENRIIGAILDPQLEEIIGILYDVIKGTGSGSSTTGATTTGAAATGNTTTTAKALVQLRT